MSKYAKESLAYTAIFCLGYLVACGGGSAVLGGGSGTFVNSTTPQMANSDLRPMSIVQSGTRVQPAIASLLRRSTAKVTIPNPSDVGQSFESDCLDFGTFNGPFTSVHAAWGNSGLVSMTYKYGTFGACLQTQPLSSVGSDENGTPQGYPIIEDGTVNTLVVYGAFVSGTRFRCVDTLNTSGLSDGAFIRAYYDLAHDAVVLGSGTTQLLPTCNISIPAGDDVIELHAQWIKS